MSRHTAKVCFDRQPDDPAEGPWLTDDDMKAFADEVYDDLDKVIEGTGDAFKRVHEQIDHLGDLSHIGVSGGIQKMLEGFEARLSALEGGTAEPVTAEGTLEVDKYAGQWVRIRDTGGLLADGQPHWLDFGLATVPGPNGEVYPTSNDMPTGTGGAYFDDGGNIGDMVGQTGSPISLSTLKNWVKYGAASASGHYYLLGTLDTSGEHPRLTISQVVSV